MGKPNFQRRKKSEGRIKSLLSSLYKMIIENDENAAQGKPISCQISNL